MKELIEVTDAHLGAVFIVLVLALIGLNIFWLGVTRAIRAWRATEYTETHEGAQIKVGVKGEDDD